MAMKPGSGARAGSEPGSESERNQAVRKLLDILLQAASAVNDLEDSFKTYIQRAAVQHQKQQHSQFIAEPLFKDIPQKYFDKIEKIFTREQFGTPFAELIKGAKIEDKDAKSLAVFLEQTISFNDDKTIRELSAQKATLEAQKNSDPEVQKKVKDLLNKIKAAEFDISSKKRDLQNEKDSKVRHTLELDIETLTHHKSSLEQEKQQIPYKSYFDVEARISELSIKIQDRYATISLEKSLQYFLGDNFYDVLKASFTFSTAGAQQRYQLCIETIHNINKRGTQKAMAAQRETVADITLAKNAATTFEDFVFSATQMIANLETLRTFPQNKAVEFLNTQLASGADIDDNSKFMIFNVLVRVREFLKGIKEFSNDEERKNMMDILQDKGIDVKQVEEQLKLLEKAALPAAPEAVVAPAASADPSAAAGGRKSPPSDTEAESLSAERKRAKSDDKRASPKTSMFDSLRKGVKKKMSQVVDTLIALETTLGKVPSPASKSGRASPASPAKDAGVQEIDKDTDKGKDVDQDKRSPRSGGP